MAQTEATRQVPSGFWLQGNEQTKAGATANGNGAISYIDGYNGALMVEIIETAGGTAVVNLTGSQSGPWDGTTAFGFAPASAAADSTNVGYVDLTAAPPRAVSVSAITVSANMRKTYLIVDPYSAIRAVLSSVAGSASVIVRLRMLAS